MPPHPPLPNSYRPPQDSTVQYILKELVYMRENSRFRQKWIVLSRLLNYRDAPL
jgi:hypothetical protein